MGRCLGQSPQSLCVHGGAGSRRWAGSCPRATTSETPSSAQRRPSRWRKSRHASLAVEVSYTCAPTSKRGMLVQQGAWPKQLVTQWAVLVCTRCCLPAKDTLAVAAPGGATAQALAAKLLAEHASALQLGHGGKAAGCPLRRPGPCTLFVCVCSGVDSTPTERTCRLSWESMQLQLWSQSHIPRRDRLTYSLRLSRWGHLCRHHSRLRVHRLPRANHL